MATHFVYDHAKGELADGTIVFLSDTVKVILAKDADYTPDQADHYRSAVTEITGTGYTAGGLTLAGKSISVDTTLHRATFDANDVTWGAVSLTARYAIVYKNRGGASSADELISCSDFGADVTLAGIIWNTAGIFYY